MMKDDELQVLVVKRFCKEIHGKVLLYCQNVVSLHPEFNLSLRYDRRYSCRTVIT